MTETISKRELARRLGVVPSRISALIKRGLPVLADGKIDLEAASKWMKANCEASVKFRDRGVNKMLEADIGHEPAEAASLDDDAAVLDYPAARALRETFLARMARLEFLAKSGKLLPADEVETVWRNYLTDCRKRLLCVPSRCGARLSHLSRAEVSEIDFEIHAALQELAGESPE
jgi:phage terminase Nu1 subunit (DNA packaging protein)